MKNNYKISEDNKYIIIYLKTRKGEISQTLIDIEDFEKVNKYRGTFFQKFDKYVNGYYAVICIYLGTENKKPQYNIVRLNRIVMDCYDKDKLVDHILGDTLDNRKNNLRITDSSTNAFNRQRINSNNKSGYRNVCKIDNKWCVQLQINGKNTVLKTFPLNQLDEAGAYAKEMREKYYGEYAGIG
jgi:hypothetical protein